MREAFKIVIILLLPLYIYGQKEGYEPNSSANEYYKKAQRAYYSKAYKMAVGFCVKAKEADPKFIEPYKLLGSIYSNLGKYEEEKKIYIELLEIDTGNATALVGLGTTNYNQGNYKEAFRFYSRFLTKQEATGNIKNIVTERVKKIKFGLDLMSNPVDFQPINAGPNINTRVNEYFPTLTVDGETMYFTRRKVKEEDGVNEMLSLNPNYFNEDIMVSHKVNEEWQKAKDAPGLNTPENEGAMCISPDGSFMILTACNRPDALGSCDLYISFLKDNEWTKPVNMGEPVNSRFYETQPSISFDGRTIYFVSKRPGGIGGMDIYMSTRDDNWNFSPPVNLGSKINTPDDEQSPFIHPDNQTLYFCSSGQPGLGKNDIFYARKNVNGQFDSVTNIGYPINTTGDETGLVVDRLGEYAFYSSSGNNTLGGLDIFYFKLPTKAKPKPVTYIKGKVFDADTKAPLLANFELADLSTGKSILKSLTSSTGEFLVPIPEGKDYLVNVSAKGYLFYSDNIPLKNYHSTEPFIKDIPLPPIKVGQKITLRNIFFKTDSYNLLDESTTELDRLVLLLKSNPKIKIEISGHTDNTGTPIHNKDLSLKRAQSVYNYLVTQGKIPVIQLKFAGYGESQPIEPNTTEEGKAQNRRTEVKIID